MLIRNSQDDKKKTSGRKKQLLLYYYFGRDHLTKSSKQEFFRFLLQDILRFTHKNMSEHYDYPLLQSMLKVFTFSKVQSRFAKDKVTEVSIQ